MPFDQFKQKGVKSTYSWEQYTTSLNEGNLTKDQINAANKISSEIETKEKVFKTCDAEVNESEEAQFSNVIRQEKKEMLKQQPTEFKPTTTVPVSSQPAQVSVSAPAFQPKTA